MRTEIAAALEELAGRDPVLDALIERHPPPPLRRPLPGGDRFEALARSIAYQQLAGAAASTIWGRVLDLLEDVGGVTPEGLMAADAEALRACGLSNAKTRSLLDLADHVGSGRLRLETLGRYPEDQVVERLTAVRGIGPWTAQMFLMFSLSRLDVWPEGDVGVANGFAAAWGWERRPTPREMPEIGAAFAPYRSIVACYCWAEIDTVTPDF